ncbi:hypothetical protein Trco_004901 [Trichoderma cornu-damae]|uniref:Uncharacterized protein n=1 Tax=Trichoderma cornu-damae TaxID=654480 RepID=A0A9P8QMG3_9HYPO|nr:hypothetical protein Trco_004901 [Trichoderma cornu-damae]
MSPDHPDMQSFTDSDVEAVLQGPLQGSLQGTFHTPELSESLIDSMSMTSYVAPTPQAFQNYAIGSPALWANNNSQQATVFPFMINEAGERLHISQYTKCKADSGIDQINGVVIVCDAGVEKDGLNSPKGNYYYKKCKKLGSGAQINGLEVVYHGGSQVPGLPNMPGHWDEMDMLNAEGKDIKGMPKNQINGGRIRLMKRTEMGTTAGGSS